MSQKKSLHDPFSGGRHLNAITHSKNLNTLEKFFMLNLGAMMDFRDIIHSSRYVSYTKMAELMSCSIKTIQRISVSLRTRGYINVENRFGEDERQQSNVYSLTDLVFEEYCATLWPDSQSGGGRTDSPTNLPKKEFPQEEIIISKDIIIGVDTDVSPDNSPPAIESVIKTPKPRKNSPKEKARRLFKGVYRRVRQDHEPHTKFIRFNTNEQMDTVFDRLWGKYDLKAFQASYDYVESIKMLGALLWNPNVIEQQIIEAIEWRNANDNS